MESECEIAKILLETEAVKLNILEPFVWASGIVSPVYCDNRVVLSYPKHRFLIKNALIEKCKELGSFDYIAGVATAGISIATMIADGLNLPLVYVRSSAKKHGRKNKIEGRIVGRPKTLVVEDLISTGGSSLKAVQALRDVGAKVSDVLSIFNYGFEYAQGQFERNNCRMHSLCRFDNLLDTAQALNRINKADIDYLCRWQKSTSEQLNQNNT